MTPVFQIRDCCVCSGICGGCEQGPQAAKPIEGLPHLHIVWVGDADGIIVGAT